MSATSRQTDETRSAPPRAARAGRLGVHRDGRETGRSRGFGFVEMANDEEAHNAINAMNGQNLDGRDLTVNEAKPREPRPGGGGGGFGGGRSGGGGGGGRGFGGGVARGGGGRRGGW